MELLDELTNDSDPIMAVKEGDLITNCNDKAGNSQVIPDEVPDMP